LSILDPHPGDPDAANFDDLANALLEQGELISPSELQGCICGLLGGGLRGPEEGLLSAVEQTLNLSLHGSLADSALALRAGIVNPIVDGDLDFRLLLPDDSFDLAERISAMSNWCRGFLSGYAQARVSAERQGDAVAPDSAESLRDFAAIAQAADPEGEDENEAEEHYEELYEYLRVAAMNVLMDAGIGEADEAGSEDP
jgi:uncharacterized protein YgfB (UPF0149 family)